MANKQRGEIVLLLDKQRMLKFDMNAFAEFEDLTGKPVTQLTPEKIGIKEIRALVWAGLKYKEPKIAVREAGRLATIGVQRNGFKPFVEQLFESILLGLGINKEEAEKAAKEWKEKNENSDPNGTGSK